MLSQKERNEILFDIKEKQHKKYSEKKLKKKLDKVFKKLNRVNTYKFYEDEDNNTYYNFLYFLTYLEKLCRLENGKKFTVRDIETTISVFFEGNMTYRAAKTLDHINKKLKKSEDKKINNFPFSKGILESDSFVRYIKNSEKNKLDGDWEVLNHSW